jgi:kinesin family member C1
MAARPARTGSLHYKENEPAGKRQRTVASAGRQPLAPASQPPAEEPIVFTAREDVDNLLNEKMKGKNKMDYKVGSISSPLSLGCDSHQ